MNKSTPTKPSIVFCHGIWADGSCFNKVIPAFRRRVTRCWPPNTASTRTKAIGLYGQVRSTFCAQVGAVWCEGVRHRKSNGPSGSLTKKENSHERAY
jgi:hypothetical protein